MGILDRFVKGLVNKDLYGFNVAIDKQEPRLPVYSQWFYTAPMGQPRNINVTDLRTFGKCAWTQMVKNTIKKELSIIPYDVVPVDDDDETDYEEDIKKVKDFLNRVNGDNECLSDIVIPMIEDVCDIDAGAWVKVYTNSSYMIGQVPVYDIAGDIVSTREGLILKPLGQRELKEIRIADGSTLLKQVDYYRRLLCWYQYSYKNPRSNPRMFFPDEVIYFMMNSRSDSVYGFSPLQSVQQVLEVLINSTRWNKDYFKNNAIPDALVGLPGATPESMKQFKDMVENTTRGKAHKLLYHNTAATFQSLVTSARDMEWLEGQKWYFHLVFAVYGMSPTEVGFHENVNQGNQAGQERVTVKNAIKPFLTLIEKNINRNVITEILQVPNPKIKLVFLPKDHAEEQIEFDQAMQELDRKVITINEYRRRKGLDDVEWGDEPTQPQSMSGGSSFLNEEEKPTKPETNNKNDGEEKEFLIPYKKTFEQFMKQNENNNV